MRRNLLVLALTIATLGVPSFYPTSSVADASDLNPPVIDQVVAPANADAGSTITVTWRATDDVGVAGTQSNPSTGVLFYSSTGWIPSASGQKNMTSGDLKSGTYSQQLTIPNGASGTFRLNFFATDGVGRTTYLNQNINVLIVASDLTPPVIDQIVAPAKAVAGTSISVSWRVSDDVGLGTFSDIPQTAIRLTRNGASVANSGWITPRSGDKKNGNYTASLNVPAGASGTYVIYIDAYDGVGRVTNVALNLDVTSTNEDLTPPVIDQIVAPAKAVAGTSISVSWRVSDDVGLGTFSDIPQTAIRLTRNGASVANSGWITPRSGDKKNGNYTASLNVPAGASGTYVIYIDAYDGVGRVTNVALNLEVSNVKTALTPTFSVPTQTINGFTFQINNFDRNFSWTSSPNAFISATGFVTVSGLNPGQAGSATVYTARDGYPSASAVITSSAKAISAGLIPLFSSVMRTENGFTFQIANFDRNFSWTSSPNAFVSATGFVTVSGLDPGQSATAIIYTTRVGYADASAVVTSSAKGKLDSSIKTGWIQIKLRDIVSNGIIGPSGLDICGLRFTPGALPEDDVISCDESFSVDVGQLVSSSNGIVLKTINLCGTSFGPGVGLGRGVFVTCTSPADKAAAAQAAAEKAASDKAAAAKAAADKAAAAKAAAEKESAADVELENPEEIAGEISAKIVKNKVVLTVNSNTASADLIVVATKRGAKAVKISLTTNDDGNKTLTSKINLRGYTLTLKSGNEVLDKFVLK